jgi:hypothetical protein
MNNDWTLDEWEIIAYLLTVNDKAGQSRNNIGTSISDDRIISEKNNKQKSVICRVRTCAGYPMGFQVPRLNHSAKMTALTFYATLILLSDFDPGILRRLFCDIKHVDNSDQGYRE